MPEGVELPPPEYSRREAAAILLPWANTDQHRQNPVIEFIVMCGTSICQQKA